jgi:antitoxin component YwqK of YwqJK toxin-antitoxin module
MKEQKEMKKQILSIVLAAAMMTAVMLTAYAANGDVVWKKNFGGSDGDRYNGVTTVPDGIVAVGWSSHNSFGNGDWVGVSGKCDGDLIASDATIVKYDNDGDVVWKKNFGGNGTDSYEAVTAVSDGVVAVGSSLPESFGNGDWEGVTAKGIEDAIIVKYDNDGNVVWKKNFGGSGVDRFQGVTAVSGGVVAVGIGDLRVPGYADAIIVKYDEKGNVVWEKNFSGNHNEYYNAVTAVSDGVVAVGNVTAPALLAIIVKYDNDGNVVWKKNFGGSDVDQFQGATAVSDGVVAVGSACIYGTGDWEGVPGNGHYDAIIVKYDDDGNVVWKKNFGGSSYDHYEDVAAVSDGVVAVGRAVFDGTGDLEDVPVKNGANNAVIVKYDNDGNVVWKKSFGGSFQDMYDDVTAIPGGVVAVGVSTSPSFGTGDWEGVPGNGGMEAIIVKYEDSTPSYPPDTLTLTAESKTARPGTYIEVPILVTNNPGVSGITKLQISWDPDKLMYDDLLEPYDTSNKQTWPFTVTAIDVGGIFEGASFAPPADGTAKTNSYIRFTFATVQNSTKNGTLLTLKFKVKDGVDPGEIPLSLALELVEDEDCNEIPFNLVNGAITVPKIMYGDVNGDGRITAADATMLLQYLSEWDLGDSINLANADVNGDGRITASDVTVLLQYLAEWDVVLGPKK